MSGGSFISVPVSVSFCKIIKACISTSGRGAWYPRNFRTSYLAPEVFEILFNNWHSSIGQTALAVSNSLLSPKHLCSKYNFVTPYLDTIYMT